MLLGRVDDGRSRAHDDGCQTNTVYTKDRPWIYYGPCPPPCLPGCPASSVPSIAAPLRGCCNCSSDSCSPAADARSPPGSAPPVSATSSVPPIAPCMPPADGPT